MNDDIIPSVSEKDLGELTSQVAREIRKRSRGLPLAPHQARALRVIARGESRPARLAEALRITPRAVTSVVDDLATAGLVVVRPDPADRRAKLVTCTDKGAELLAEARAARAEIAAEMFGVLSHAERELLAELLTRVID